MTTKINKGFPGGASGEEPICQCRRCKRLEFYTSVMKIPLMGAHQPTAVFKSGHTPWTEETDRLKPVGLQRVRHD